MVRFKALQNNPYFLNDTIGVQSVYPIRQNPMGEFFKIMN